MNSIYWNYFLEIEIDVLKLSRYVELAPGNMSTYSIEIARILMASTQEIDVLLKQICQREGNSAESEQDYRTFLPTKFPSLTNLEIKIPRYNLNYIPFSDWSSNITPSWWTANNKVKHERINYFDRANIENLLNSVCALFITNIFFHCDNTSTVLLEPNCKLITCDDMSDAFNASDFGFAVSYKLP